MKDVFEHKSRRVVVGLVSALCVFFVFVFVLFLCFFVVCRVLCVCVCARARVCARSPLLCSAAVWGCV